jgi:hypothetical protein
MLLYQYPAAVMFDGGLVKPRLVTHTANGISKGTLGTNEHEVVEQIRGEEALKVAVSFFETVRSRKRRDSKGFSSAIKFSRGSNVVRVVDQT